MAPLRVSTTKSEWLPDDPTSFVPTRLWKLPFITTWDDSRNQNRPTDSAEEANFLATYNATVFKIVNKVTSRTTLGIAIDCTCTSAFRAKPDSAKYRPTACMNRVMTKW